MQDDERQLFLDRISKLEEQLSTKKPSTKTAEDYIRDRRRYGDVPRDQFAHSHKLLFHAHEPPLTQMDLLPEDAILGGTENGKQLFLLQKDNEILNRFYDMGTRSKGIMDVFNSLFYSWWQQMRMTGTINFTERILQSFIEPPFITYQGLNALEKHQAKKAGKGAFDIRSMIDRARNNMGNSGGNTYE